MLPTAVMAALAFAERVLPPFDKLRVRYDAPLGNRDT
jgi:hypothetical protein